MAHATTHEHDVIIIGGGGAGLRASIAIAEENPDYSVACVSKVYPMRSHTVTAEGGAAAKIKPNDSLEDHIYDTISGADWLADQDAVEYFVNEAPTEMIQLEHWGCPWSREPDGSVAVRPFGGMKIERTWFAADKTGFHMLHSLFQTTLKYGNIVRYDEHFATRLLMDSNGRCRGCAAIELRTGSVRAILGKAVIICTGGAGRVFPFTTNGSIKTGDGMAMAYRAGVALKDMEFIQYHPTGLPGTGILITEASRGEGGILVNRDGYRYLQDYELGEALDVTDPRHPQKRAMELGPRDRLSQCFIKEKWAGRTIETRDGHVVHLDLRHLGEAKIDRKIPFVRELSRNYAGIDPVHKPIPVRPVVHYVMGGIDVDGDSATGVPGLYAAGECACVSINGANRLGSNSLTELLVFGAQAGRHAARFAMDNPDYDVSELEAQAEDEGARIRRAWFDASRRDGERIVTLRSELHEAMEEGRGHLPRRRLAPIRLRDHRRPARTLPQRHPRRPHQQLQHRTDRGPRTWVPAGRGRGHGAFGHRAHRVARLPPAARPHRAQRRRFPRPLAGPPPAGRIPAADRVQARDDHEVAARSPHVRRRIGTQEEAEGRRHLTWNEDVR